MLYSDLLRDIDIFTSRLHNADPLMSFYHGVWDLELPYDTHFAFDYVSNPERFDNPTPLDSFESLPASGEWNEYLGRWDSLDENHQRFIIILKQVYPFLMAIQRMYREFKDLLDSDEFPAYHDGQPLLKKAAVRGFLLKVPAIMNRMKFAVKHRVTNVLSLLLPPGTHLSPELMIFPNELYRDSPGVLPHFFNDGFAPELRALHLSGSAFCVAFHSFRAIGAAFNRCRGLNKTYWREDTTLPVLLPDSFVAARFQAAMDDLDVDYMMMDLYAQFMHHSAAYNHAHYPTRIWMHTVFLHGPDWNDGVPRLLVDGTYPAGL